MLNSRDRRTEGRPRIRNGVNSSPGTGSSRLSAESRPVDPLTPPLYGRAAPAPMAARVTVFSWSWPGPSSAVRPATRRPARRSAPQPSHPASAKRCTHRRSRMGRTVRRLSGVSVASPPLTITVFGHRNPTKPVMTSLNPNPNWSGQKCAANFSTAWCDQRDGRQALDWRGFLTRGLRTGSR